MAGILSWIVGVEILLASWAILIWAAWQEINCSPGRNSWINIRIIFGSIMTLVILQFSLKLIGSAYMIPSTVR